MKYGYARISTPKQVIDRQIRNIKREHPDAFIIEEAYTGTSLDRPKWMNLYKKVVEKDIIVFDEVSRMSRNAEEGFAVYQELFYRGVTLIFLKEPHINTEAYKKAMDGVIAVININSGDNATDELVATIVEAINRFIMNKVKQDIYAAFEQAEKEVLYLRQRTKEGIVTARLKGKQIGGIPGKKRVSKKEGATKDTILKHCKDFGGSLSDIDCIILAKVSRNTYYKYKRELHDEQERRNLCHDQK